MFTPKSTRVKECPGAPMKRTKNRIRCRKRLDFNNIPVPTKRERDEIELAANKLRQISQSTTSSSEESVMFDSGEDSCSDMSPAPARKRLRRAIFSNKNVPEEGGPLLTAFISSDATPSSSFSSSSSKKTVSESDKNDESSGCKRSIRESMSTDCDHGRIFVRSEGDDSAWIISPLWTGGVRFDDSLTIRVSQNDAVCSVNITARRPSASRTSSRVSRCLYVSDSLRKCIKVKTYLDMKILHLRNTTRTLSTTARK